MIDTVKKGLLIIFTILFFLSVIHDLKEGTFHKEVSSNVKVSNEMAANIDRNQTKVPDKEPEMERFIVKAYKVKPGDTVLTIVEKINVNGPPVSMNQMILDFQNLNPEVNVHKIKVDQIYQFPVYQ